MSEIMRGFEMETFRVITQTPSGRVKETGERIHKRLLMPHQSQVLLMPFKDHKRQRLQYVFALAPSAQPFVAQANKESIGMQFVTLSSMLMPHETNEVRQERGIAQKYMQQTFRQLAQRLVDVRIAILSGEPVFVNYVPPPPPLPQAAAAAAASSSRTKKQPKKARAKQQG
jgi:hypothetical protein